ncbi:MAG: 4Fe-4S dicluster domain-containing protein [Planctomycetota bacterium]
MTKDRAKAQAAAGAVREGAPWRFRGGKRISLPGAPSGEIEDFAAPDTVTIACSDCKATVEKGAGVRRGQVIARPEGGEDAQPASPFHASVGGVVDDVREDETEDGGVVSIITIRGEGGDGDDAPKALEPADVSGASAADMLVRLHESGVAALVPGGIPTGKGGSVAEGVQVARLVVPLAAPEPFLPDPLVIIRERPDDFAEGLRLVAKALGGAAVHLAGTSEAFEAVRALDTGPAEFHRIKDVHPAGSELMLAWLALGKPAALPLRAVQAGVVIAGAQDVIVARDALVKGIAVTDRVVALAGIDEPRTVRARVGTALAALVPGSPRVVKGGLMSGTLAGEGAALSRDDSALAALPAGGAAAEAKACIACGRCTGICPTKLFPVMLARLAPRELYEEAEELGLDRCVECGLCTFVCPARIDLAGALGELKMGLAEERESE